MSALIFTIVLMVLVFFIQDESPMLAGIVAVIPLKILGTAFITFESGGAKALTEAVEGMLVGQCLWGLALLGVYLYLTK